MPKIVYIAHPIRGNVSENQKAVIGICKKLHSKTVIPFAPYLVGLNYLDDTNSTQRKIGLFSSKPFFDRKTIDETWLCGPRISEGMKNEIQWSVQNGIPVRCHNPLLETELKKILAGSSNQKKE